MNLAIPFLLLFLSNGARIPELRPRTPFKGKSGRTWFVVDSTAGASSTPVRDVFANATGRELVLTFAVVGPVRARMFVAPTPLSQVALSDFQVSTVQAGKL
jgi:hypothetical protein